MILPLLACLALAVSPSPWKHPLCLGGGGVWRLRVPVTVRNAGTNAAAGTPVALRVGDGPGELRLAGQEAAALRVTDAAGVEMLHDIVGPTGAPARTGALRTGSSVVIPVACAAGSQATYYVYCANPSAWAVPDWLESGGSLRNGGVEEGDGPAPAGWAHDAADASHRAEWSTEVPHTGSRCLKTVVAEGAEPSWIATRQSAIRIEGGARYRMSAWVRAEGVRGLCGWYIHLGTAADPMLASPMLSAGEGSFGWTRVQAEFTVPAEADRADLGTVLRGTGTAWFDDLELERLDAGAPALSAEAGEPEKLGVTPAPARTPWPSAPRPEAISRLRTPIRLLNTSDRPTEGIVCVEAPAVLSRMQGSGAGLRVMDGGKPTAHYRLRDVLLLKAAAAARTERVLHAYVMPATSPSRGGARSTVQYALNPAVPGGANVAAGGMSVKEYAALMAAVPSLVRNAGFEEGAGSPAGWQGGSEGEKPAGAEMTTVDGGLFGKRCARIVVPADATPSWTGWRQDVPVRPNRTYLYAAWLRCKELSGGVQLHAHMRTASGELCKQNAMVGAGPPISGDQGWTLITGLFRTPDDCAVFQVHLTMMATGTVWHDGVLLTEVQPAEALPSENRPERSTGVATWAVNPIVKVFREDTPPAAAALASVTAAGGEQEPVQVALRSGAPVSGVRVVVDAPTGPGGRKLARYEVGLVGYVPIDQATNYYSDRGPAYTRKVPSGPAGSDGWPGWWPDPILPGDRFDLAAGRTQPVWVTFSIPRGCPAGLYKGAVRFVARGKLLARMPVTVRVWGFDLPERPSLKAIYDCRQSGPMWQIAGKSEQEVRQAFWRFMADRRTCPDSVKPDPEFRMADGVVTADFTDYDKAARVYFDELHLPHSYTPWFFYSFGWGHLPTEKLGLQPYAGAYPFEGADRRKLNPAYKKAYQDALRLFWNHVKEKGWADRITLYISDEPFDTDAKIRDQMLAVCEAIREVDPAIPIYSSTWHHQPAWDGALSVWGIGHYGVVPEATMRRIQSGGAAIWWTTDGQMCTDTPTCAIERLLPHYAFKYGASAYEFWGVDWLTYDPYQRGWHQFLMHDFGPGVPKEYVRYPNGDGFLAYPPGPRKLDRPVTSVRLEQAREGMEDYEILTLLRRAIETARKSGKPTASAEKALAMAQALVSSPCDIGRYSTRILPSPDRVPAVKAAAAAAIEALGI